MARVVNEDLPTPPSLAPGTYEHYKGNRYTVIGVALDTETLEPSVIYRPLYDSKVSYWVRPYAMFTESIKVGDTWIPQFRKVQE